MTVAEIKRKILTDFGFFASVVISANPNGVNDAIAEIDSVYFSLDKSQLWNMVMSYYRSSPKQAAQLLNVPYVYNVNSPEVDQAVREMASTAFAGAPMLRNEQANSNGTASTGWNWGDLFSALPGIITAVGNQFTNGSTGSQVTPNQTIDTGANQPPAPTPTNYTPYIIGGAVLVLLLVGLAVYMKKK